MAGRNAKRRAKAAKAGKRSLEMPKELWRMMASVTTMAGAMGASESVAERCHKVAARAEYYLGETENKAGQVRGELTRDEWETYRELVEEVGDTSPQVKALADALAELEQNDLEIRQMIDVREESGDARRDTENGDASGFVERHPCLSGPDGLDDAGIGPDDTRWSGSKVYARHPGHHRVGEAEIGSDAGHHDECHGRYARPAGVDPRGGGDGVQHPPDFPGDGEDQGEVAPH